MVRVVECGPRRDARNAEALGVRLARADAVVLSHGHYDHTGGVALLLEGRRHLPVTRSRGAFATRYARRGGEASEIGMPPECREAVAHRAALRCSSLPLPACGGVSRRSP